MGNNIQTRVISHGSELSHIFNVHLHIIFSYPLYSLSIEDLKTHLLSAYCNSSDRLFHSFHIWGLLSMYLCGLGLMSQFLDPLVAPFSGQSDFTREVPARCVFTTTSGAFNSPQTPFTLPAGSLDAFHSPSRFSGRLSLSQQVL